MKKRIVSLVLALLMIGTMVANAQSPFADVNESDAYYTNVCFAEYKGILNGIDGLFKPYKNLTVAEAIKISACINACDFERSVTPYENSAHWADAYYDYAVKNGIIKEDDFTRADFDKYVTRDRFFYMLANSMSEDDYPAFNDIKDAPEDPSYLTKLFCAGIVIGDGESFNRDGNLNRAEAATLISRMLAHSKRQIAGPIEELDY